MGKKAEDAATSLGDGEILDLFKQMVDAADKSPDFKRVARAVIAEMRFSRARQRLSLLPD